MSIERFTTSINGIKFHFETFHMKRDIWYNTLLFYQDAPINFDLYTDQHGRWQIQKWMDVPNEILTMKHMIADAIEHHNASKWKNDFFYSQGDHLFNDSREMSYEHH